MVIKSYVPYSSFDKQPVRIGSVTKDASFGKKVPIASDDEDLIDSSNVTYYISNEILNNVTNYSDIKNINNVYIYEKSV